MSRAATPGSFARRTHLINGALVVVALLLTVAVFVDRANVTTTESEGRKMQLFDAWRRADVAQVEIHQGKQTVLLVRDPVDDTWALTIDGKTLESDETAIDTYMVSLEFASFERRAGGASRASMGLDKPHATYDIKMGKLSYRLVVGGLAPAPEGARYAEVEGGSRPKETYVLSKALIDELTVEPSTLRSRSIVTVLSPDVQRYAMTLPGSRGRWTLERATWGGRLAAAWTVTGADDRRVRANRRQVDGWLALLGQLEVDRGLPVPKTPEKRAHLTIVPQEGEPVEVWFGGPCDKGGTMVVRSAPEPLAGCVRNAIASAMLLDEARLVDGYPIGAPSADLIEMSFKEGDKGLELARKGDGWLMRRPAGAQADPAAVADWIERLTRTQGSVLAADASSDLASLGLDPPRITVQLIAQPDRHIEGSKERVERFSVSSPRDGKVFVKREDDGAVVALAKDVARTLLPRPGKLRSAQVIDVKQRHVRGLTLDCAGRKQMFARDAGGLWTRPGKKDGELGPDSGLTSGLGEMMRGLKALRWVGEEADPDFKLDQPWCTIVLRAADPEASLEAERDRSITVTLGAETQGGYYARRGDDAAVFVAPRPLASSARRWLHDRKALLVPLDRVLRASISKGDARLGVRKQGDAWVAEEGTPQPAAQALRDTLVGLLAEGVVDFGAADASAGLETPRATLEVVLAGAEEERVTITIGAGDVWRDVRVFYVRRAGIDATFAVAQARLAPVLNSF